MSKYNGYTINGCRYHTKEQDDLRTTQNSGVSVVASTMQIARAKDKNPIFGELCFYRIITEIWDLDYTKFRIPVFKCGWVNNNKDIKVDELGFTLVDLTKVAYKSDSFILASQAKQVFYVQDQLESRWSIVLSQKDFLHKEGVDDLIEVPAKHHPSISAIPKIYSFDDMDYSQAICMWEDSEGIWIENNSSM